jgi:hypothetical protein
VLRHSGAITTRLGRDASLAASDMLAAFVLRLELFPNGGAMPRIAILFAFVLFAAQVQAFAEQVQPAATRRPRLDLTGKLNRTQVIPAHLVTPEMAENIGPGSHLLIEIPGEGLFGCTANFVWAAGSARYLGAAGHCFIPALATATHGVGADYNASGVVVSVCVSDCSFGGETGFVLTGNLVELGQVAYARQTAADGDVGNDFGVAAIPAALAALVRPSMPVFGGPTGVEEVDPNDLLCHYGNGVIVGETFPTMARIGVAGGSNPKYWMGDLAAAFGDSGSAVVTCESHLTGIDGRGAAGVLTHLGVEVSLDPLQQGVVFGTTIARAIEMAREAGLSLTVVLQ